MRPRKSLPILSGGDSPGGARLWRSLDDWLDDPVARASGHGEFPDDADKPPGISRRDFVRLLGASAAFAGIGACVQPADEILPYVMQPPELTPGEPLHFATAMTLGGYATGLLVESHVGRPTKIEGNPQHPASLGAAGVLEQASILQLYDPHRARTIRRGNSPASWSALGEWLRALPADGEGLRVLLEPTSSPLVISQLDRLRERYARAQVHYYAPLTAASAIEGARRAFGRALVPQHDFRAADVVLALDADFLATMPFHLRYARHFAARRRIRQPTDVMNRLYVAEAMVSVTGGFADHRLRVRPSEIPRLALDLLGAVSRSEMEMTLPAALRPLAQRSPLERTASWVRAVARDLREHAGRSIVIAGDSQPAAVHMLVHAINAVLGNVGRTVTYTESAIVEAGQGTQSLQRLVDAMRAGVVGALLILDGNPSYASPADLEFALLLQRVPHRLYLGLYENETARDCEWMVPMAHYLESWGDARAYDGTVSLIQPLVAPLFGGRSASEVLAVLLGDDVLAPRELLRSEWRRDGVMDETRWISALQLGLVPGTAHTAISADIRWPEIESVASGVGESTPAGGGSLDISFAADPRLYDGRFANNAWLQEMPDPMTTLTWGNAAVVSPRTAAAIAAETGAFIELTYRGRSLRLPLLVLPGHADGVVTVRLGYGRQGGEQVARAVGGNAYTLWNGAFADTGATLAPLDGGRADRSALALTQMHWTMEGRPIALAATLEAYRRNPNFTDEHRGPTPSLYEPFIDQSGNQWAMAIDLSLCTGCGACAVACQAENNVPIVGREGVLRSREMHWLRIDRYFTGTAEDPAVVMQPMLCQHCEKAPCEYVCPVNATVHSTDGLNEMVYNRCVGTRFCSNNCPYKVRRFNWFDYSAGRSETEAMLMNPDVTVRERGVMEKCTFCVQRIRQGEIAARVEGRSVRPGEIRTACQQACPTEAIVFGSYTQDDEALQERLRDPRRYSVLHALGTRPRVHYLARITNPNDALAGGA